MVGSPLDLDLGSIRKEVNRINNKNNINKGYMGIHMQILTIMTPDITVRS